MSLRLGLYARQLRDLPHDLRHGEVWPELRRRSLDQVYERGRFVVVEQDLDRAWLPSPPPGVSLSIAEDPSVLEQLAPRRVPAGLARRESCRCLVAWSAKRPLGYECWSRELHPELDLLPVPLPPGTAWGHDLYVAPEVRGKGIGTALAAARIADVREHGLHRLRRLIEAGNAASWRTAERSAPLTRVGEVWFVKTPGRLRTGFEPA